MDSKDRFRILSLDGGGIRGAFSAAFLATLESKLKLNLVDHFDLIAGTSTGGIIAAALAAGEPASRIVAMYREHGQKIFQRNIPKRGMFQRAKVGVMNTGINWALKSDYDALYSPKYDGQALRRALEEVFQKKRVSDITATRLLIPTINLTTGTTVVIKTPHLPDLFRDKKHPLVDVIMATTAAPTYFPHAVIDPGSAYIDGGLWANNPSMVAYVEALKIAEKCCRPGIDPLHDHTSIRLLSVGTGESQSSVAPDKQKAGQNFWKDHIFDTTINSQSQSAENQIRYLMGNTNYQRINFRLPDTSWQLDSVQHLDRLIHLGEEEACRKVANLENLFFSNTKKQFVVWHS